jgi:ribosomal protein S18 acetylase RimI-like enzyme
MITVRRGTSQDAASLAELAATTFRDTFARDNRPEDLALHLSRAYGLAQQTAELADPTVTTLLAYVDGHLAGYAQLRPGAPPLTLVSSPSVELWRFYVAQAWHGHGVAQELMRAVVSAARDRGATTLWLGVWERNQRAQAFYRKAGFEDVGAQVFVLGTDEQTDRVMRLQLQPPGFG